MTNPEGAMSFQLTKTERKLRDQLLAQLQQTSADTANAIDAFNAQMAVLWMNLSQTINAHNKVLAAVETFRQEIAERLQNEFDEKSDRWQESKAGEAADEMIDQWSEPFYGLEIERPDDLDGDDMPDAKILSNLPTELSEDEDEDED
jgi:hypothetical protein